MTEAELDALTDEALSTGLHPERRLTLGDPPQCAQCHHARHIAACATAHPRLHGDCDCPGTPLLPPLPKAYR